MSIDRWLRIVALRLRSLARRDEVERELDDELQFHLAQQTAQNIRQGMTPDDAHYAALRALGGLAYRKEQVRDTRGVGWLEDIGGDVRFALRSVRRARGFSATVILTLALGIGANTAMFTLLRGTLLKPLPNRDGDRLVYLRQSAPAAQRHNVNFSVPEVADLRASSHTLAELAEYSSAVPFVLVDLDQQPRRVIVGVITGNYFEVMGLSPVLGRVTNAHDDGPDATSVAVLSYQFWQEHFGGDPHVIGRTIRLNDKLSTIVGVVQDATAYPKKTDVFVNIVTSPHHLSSTMVTDRNHRMSELFARLAPGATLGQVRAEVARTSAVMFHDHPDAYEKAAHYTITVTPLRGAINEGATLTFWVLMAAAAFVLIIACANVSNLTLMRGVGREREMLVRAALGAGTARLRRLLIVENLTLALSGGLLGVLVAVIGVKLLVAFAAQFTPRATEVRVDGVVLVVGFATAITAALVLSFVPRIGADGALAASLVPTAGGRRVTLGRGRQRLQRSLVVAQIAVCMVLLSAAGLLVRTLAKLTAVQAGVRVDHVVTMDLPLSGDLVKEIFKISQNFARYRAIRDRVAAVPGVSIAAMGSDAPLRPALLDMELAAEGRTRAPNEPMPHAAVKMVDPNYFQAAGIPLIAGRDFATTDARGTGPVAVLNESFARRLFGGEDPIGRRVAFTGATVKLTPFSEAPRTVVAIAGDTRDRGLDNDAVPTIYLPFAQEIIINGALVVRTSADPSVVQPAIVKAVHELYPRQLIEHVQTMEQIRDETVAPRRLNATFIAAFGGLAFLIAMVGIAGVLAFSVSSRTSEIGIRMSLGADGRRVRRMILGEGGVLVVFGVAIGLVGAFFATRLLQALLFGVTPHDPVTLGGVAFVLGVVGVAACWLPAARAARVDPAVALRAE